MHANFQPASRCMGAVVTMRLCRHSDLSCDSRVLVFKVIIDGQSSCKLALEDRIAPKYNIMLQINNIFAA